MNRLAQNFELIEANSGLLQPKGIGGLFSLLLPYIFYISGLLLLVYMILGGFQMMFAKGDPKAMQSAQGKITNALLGFVIVIVAYGLVSLLGRILGINVFVEIFGDM